MILCIPLVLLSLPTTGEKVAFAAADPVKEEEIEERINQMYRIKDSKGEWLVYDLIYSNTRKSNSFFFDNILV
jgi:hypothetical protein